MIPGLDTARSLAGRAAPLARAVAAPFARAIGALGDAPPVPGLAPADAAHCRALLAAGSRTFAAAGLLLPPHLRDAAAALYGFCRVSDDAVDLSADPAAAVAALRARLDRIYAAGAAVDALDDPVDRAFAAVVHARAVPRAVPAALLEGYAWDAEGRRYETLSDLRAFCARVASSVGVMVTHLLGRHDPVVLARACDLGVAMQLTNIARDVGEDARAGRVYLPLAWLRAAGVDPDDLTPAPRFSPALGGVVCRLLDEAAPLYGRAATGLSALPLTVRPAFHAAAILYAAIGDVVRARGGDSVSARAFTSPGRKAVLLAVAVAGVATLAPIDPSPPLPETAFLCGV